MTDHELERRLRTALDHAAPNDLEGVLSRCETGKGTVIDMTNAVETKKKKRRWAPLAAAACLALVLVGGGGGYYYYSANNAVASLVSLDVNPSIQLEVNKNEKVLSATPMNDDGAEILDGMDLKGTQADVAMYAIIGSLLQHGYVDELANSILITVEDDDQARGEKLQQELTAQADAALANAQVNGAVLAQTLQNSEELSQKAQEYGISTGKAALIQAIVAGSNNTKTFEDLVGLSINELNLLYTAQAPLEGQTSGNEQEGVIGGEDGYTFIVTEGPPIVVTGSASQSAYIGPEAAKEAALKHAGVSASDATFVEAEYDYDDGRMVYEVEFHVKGTEYDCEIDAQTGEVVKYKTEQNGANTGGSSANTSSFIGESAAKAAALSHAGVSESSTKYCNAWLEYDDGRAECYEVKFMAGNTRYEYKIALTSATVLESERESYGGSGSSGQSTRQSGSQTSGGSGTSSTDIGAEKAKSIALNHAGVSASQTSEMKVEQDWDDGVLEYEVEFKAGGVEYEYTIHGGTGQILKYESDRD